MEIFGEFKGEYIDLQKAFATHRNEGTKRLKSLKNRIENGNISHTDFTLKKIISEPAEKIKTLKNQNSKELNIHEYLKLMKNDMHYTDNLFVLLSSVFINSDIEIDDKSKEEWLKIMEARDLDNKTEYIKLVGVEAKKLLGKGSNRIVMKKFISKFIAKGAKTTPAIKFKSMFKLSKMNDHFKLMEQNEIDRLKKIKQDKKAKKKVAKLKIEIEDQKTIAETSKLNEEMAKESREKDLDIFDKKILEAEKKQADLESKVAKKREQNKSLKEKIKDKEKSIKTLSKSELALKDSLGKLQSSDG